MAAHETYHPFESGPQPAADLDEAAIAAHARIVERHTRLLMGDDRRLK